MYSEENSQYFDLPAPCLYLWEWVMQFLDIGIAFKPSITFWERTHFCKLFFNCLPFPCARRKWIISRISGNVWFSSEVPPTAYQRIRCISSGQQRQSIFEQKLNIFLRSNMVQTAFCFFKMLKQKTYKAANHTFIKNLAVFFQNIKFCKA